MQAWNLVCGLEVLLSQRGLIVEIEQVASLQMKLHGQIPEETGEEVIRRSKVSTPHHVNQVIVPLRET